MSKQYIAHAYKLTTPIKVTISNIFKAQIQESSFEFTPYKGYGRNGDYTVTLPIGTTVIYDGGNGYDVSYWRVKDMPRGRGGLPQFGCDSGGHEWMSSYGDYIKLKSLNAGNFLMHIYE